MIFRRNTLILAFLAGQALAFTPTPCRTVHTNCCTPSGRSLQSSNRNTRIHETVDENTVEPVDEEIRAQVSEMYPEAELLTLELTEHKPLGCTVEESFDTENDPSIVFVSKVVPGGNADKVGIKAGDVLAGVTGLFGEVTPVLTSGVEKIKGFVASLSPDKTLTFQIARNTGVMERHETAVVDLCQSPESGDKAVEECLIDYWRGDFDDSGAEDMSEECDLDDPDANCLIDSMMDLWADELPPPTTTSGITNADGATAAKPKPWSSRSSPSGTYVRDPVTGEMRNIDA
mmetsp:Transcript_73639/g.213316  ORF Transcript_73639/g.213316 Transcript_73639/m.213316 type:complete len:288 (+) Transcript_73639:124-987(+)